MVSFNILSLSTELLLVGQSANRDKSQDAESKAVDSAEPQAANSVKGNGVYIQDINGNLWEVDDWDGSVAPNAIAVIADESKFLIALTQMPSAGPISRDPTAPIDDYMAAALDTTEAKAEYDGAGNTAKILKVESCTDYAAGYCDAFIFPDNKTKGYLPSLGQLNLAYQNKAAVDAALGKCGGTAMSTSCYYWSSTFWGVYCGYRRCWRFGWSDGYVFGNHLGGKEFVRPFANF